MQFAKKKGLKVVGIDARDDGLAITEAMGADLVVDARKGKDEVVKEVQAATTTPSEGGGGGVDATVTLADASSAAALGCAVTKMHGTMVQVAQPQNVSIPFQEFVFRDVRVKGSVVASPGESEAMVRFIADSGVRVKTNVYEGLDKIEELLKVIHGGKIQGKAVIVVDQEQIEREKELGAKY